LAFVAFVKTDEAAGRQKSDVGQSADFDKKTQKGLIFCWE